jgi:hypothetical protein
MSINHDCLEKNKKATMRIRIVAEFLIPDISPNPFQ